MPIRRKREPVLRQASTARSNSVSSAKPLPPGASVALIAAVSTPKSSLPRTRSSMSSSGISTWETSTASMSRSRTWRSTSYIPFSLIWSLSIMSWSPRTGMVVLRRRRAGVRVRGGSRHRRCRLPGGRSGAGGELALGLDARVELGEVLLGRVVDQIELASGPGGQVHAGGQAHAVDALGAVGDQRRAVVDVRGEVRQDVEVLLAPDRLVLLLLDGVDGRGVHLAAEQLGDVLHGHLVAQRPLVLGEPGDGD